MDTNTNQAIAEYNRRKQIFERDIFRLQTLSTRISIIRFLLFLLGVILLVQGFREQMRFGFVGAATTFGGFASCVLYHWRILSRIKNAQIRKGIHERHIKRLKGRWSDFGCRGERFFNAQHPYAADIDLVGVGSLFQRISVAHTQKGETTLAGWLGRAADRDTIERRQTAVGELAERVEFRQELEAAMLPQGENESLSEGPIEDLIRITPVFRSGSWPCLAVSLMPPVMLVVIILTVMQTLPSFIWIGLLPLHFFILFIFHKQVTHTLDLAQARYSVVESFERALFLIERTDFTSPHLIELKRRIYLDETPPSSQLRRLKFWVGFAELRQQFLLHVFVNLILLWDLHILWGLERWVKSVGQHTSRWFNTLGEFEALASLANLAYGDPDSSFPEILDSPASFDTKKLSHPLLPPDTRVANDVMLESASILMITGSNMAGKSTLLRTVGVNIVLALCGGSVCAKQMRLPLVDLRTSMRVDDSLQQGASYFYAELQKLGRVIRDVGPSMPTFFLIDELLRGTNEQARQVGGLAVLEHLLKRNTMGIMATHHFGFSEIEKHYPERVKHMHFTDTMVNGNLQFDYRLRPGAVKTSNALRLLREIGIEVVDDGALEEKEEVQ